MNQIKKGIALRHVEQNEEETEPKVKNEDTSIGSILIVKMEKMQNAIRPTEESSDDDDESSESWV